MSPVPSSAFVDVRHLGDALRAGFEDMPGILAFRLTPFAGYLVLSRSCSVTARTLSAVLYLGLAALALGGPGTPPYWYALAYLYFTAAAFVLHELGPALRSRAARIGVALCFFWALPSLSIDPLPAPFSVVGFELGLASYSYLNDTRESPAPFGECAFFLLVNPALVYRNRGTVVSPPGPHAGGALRALGGVAATFFSVSVLTGVHAAAEATHASIVGDVRWLAVPVVGLLRLGRDYAAHSGVASLQIGMMRQLGWTVPERYRYPLASLSPLDFWRRWNTYVGDWAFRYVFTPLAARSLRRFGRAPRLRRVAGVSAPVVTFTVVGVLHDLAFSGQTRSVEFGATGWFAVMGVVAVVWERFAPAKANRASGRLLRRSAFVLGASVAAYFWR